MPFNARFAAVTTAFGLQAGHQELTAPSPDDPGTPAQRAVGPEQQHQRRRLRLQRVQVHRHDQGADRRPHRACRPARHDAGFIPAGFDLTPIRQSIRPAIARNLSLHAEERQRRPDPEPAVRPRRQHHRRNMSSARRSRPNCSRAARMMRPRRSTSAIPISASKPPNRSRSDCGGRQGRSGSRLTGYYTQFNGFIFRRLTGNICDETACVAAADPAPLNCKQAIYSQRDADLPRRRIPEPARCRRRSMAASGASRTSSTSCAPPSPTAPTCRAFRRCGSAAACIWRDANWLVRINLLHAFAQNDIAVDRRDADRRATIC